MCRDETANHYHSLGKFNWWDIDFFSFHPEKRFHFSKPENSNSFMENINPCPAEPEYTLPLQLV